MLLESRRGSAQHAAQRFQRDLPAFISLHGWGRLGAAGGLLPLPALKPQGGTPSYRSWGAGARAPRPGESSDLQISSDWVPDLG